MIPDIRIKYNGVNVRLVGFGFRKQQNLKILETGLRSMKLRLSRGIGQDDAPTAPLKPSYAKRKARITRRKAIRDLSLTGAMLEEIQPRYADDSMAVADASTQVGRTKARAWSDLLQFSPSDQKQMAMQAEKLFFAGTKTAVQVGRSGTVSISGRGGIQERRTSFSRAA